MNTPTPHPFIKWFADITIADIPLVGGKNASLGEMVRELAGRGVKVPDGFAVTAEAFRHFIREAKLDAFIRSTLADLDTQDMANLSQRGHAVRQAIRNASLPEDLQRLIGETYAQLQGGSATPLDVAVRSSATAEDLPDASFAGRQETYLNVQGVAALLETCKRCFASLFTDRAISYRVDKGFDHFKIALSIGVQRMVRSDLACSGVMFTIDTESGFRDAVLISAAYGLGAERLLNVRERRLVAGVLQQREKARLRGVTFLIRADEVGVAPRRGETFLGLDLAGLWVAPRPRIPCGHTRSARTANRAQRMRRGRLPCSSHRA